MFDVLWIYLPLVIGVSTIFISIKLTLAKRNYFNIFTSIILVAVNSLSIIVLVRILLGAYPTYLPHLTIIFGALLLAVQFSKHKQISKL